MQELENITIGQYYIEHQLARGGMAEIYLARDLASNQAVAIKMVHCSNTEYYERFRREAEVMSSLQHDHILPALDHGEYESWYYLVTPYIAYGTLSERLADGALSVQEAGDILEQLTDALQFAHELGIIHRDLKPSNVLLRDGKYVYLADFGAPTTSSAILPGGLPNTLLVVANGASFSLYINGTFVGEAQDSTYASGQLALAAGTLAPVQGGEGSFTQLKIFSLA